MTLSPTLTFDHLIISGDLVLSPSDAPSLAVNRLTITDTGGVRYTQSECRYSDAPNFAVDATDAVILDGDISLVGKSGSRVLPSSECKQCPPSGGGEVRITAGSISASARIIVDGGRGGIFVGVRDTGCGGGTGGRIELVAGAMNLSSAVLGAAGGSGGVAEGGNGSRGAVGAVRIDSTALLEMAGGSIATDGTLTLLAGQTRIYAPFNYGTIVELIAGQPDLLPPAVQIITPAAGAELRLDEPVEIVIDVSDAGTGVKEVRLEGLGLDQTFSGSALNGGRLTVQTLPSSSGSLVATAVDNKEQPESDSVSGLTLGGDLLVRSGETFPLREDLLLGPTSSVEILGTLTLARGRDALIRAGSFLLAPGGRIQQETAVEDTLTCKAPSLELDIAGSATIEGILDLSGSDGLPITNDHQFGEEGGDLQLGASSIVVSGSILSNGGDGVIRPLGAFGAILGSGGSVGGTILLAANLDVTLSGNLAANAGAAVNTVLGVCHSGRRGGRVLMSYSTELNWVEPSFEVSPDLPNTVFDCDPNRGVPGWVDVDYTGPAPAPPVPAIGVTEREPNERAADAQQLISVPNLRVAAFMDSTDVATLTVADLHLKDSYTVSFVEANFLGIEILGSGSDLGLILFNAKTLETFGTALSPALLIFDNTTDAFPNLAHGTYTIGVLQDVADTVSAPYQLHVVIGRQSPDRDSIGLVSRSLECPGFGDTLLTYDPITDLEWVDPPLTRGFSVLGIQNSVDTRLADFRYARGTEVCDLFNRYAVAPQLCPGIFAVVTSADVTSDLQSFLGVLLETPTQAITQGAFDAEDPNSALFGFAKLTTNLLGSSLVEVVDGEVPLDFSDINFGHYLLRGAMTDSDGDEVLDDGDRSGLVGDVACSCDTDLPLGCDQNCDDNCRWTRNPDQLDRGGLGDTGSDGVGDSCQCGDVVAPTGTVDAVDVLALRRALTGILPSSSDLYKCNVIGDTISRDVDGDGLTDDCRINDIVVIRRSLPPRASEIRNVCRPAVARTGLRR